MELIILGLVLWSVVHFIPSLAQSFKQKWKSALGEKGYMGSFALLILASVVLIVLGWRSVEPTYLYVLPAGVRPLALALIVVAFIFMGAANYPSRIKRVVRHPQLTGLVLWAAGHLMLNGDNRSVLLFSWLACWAVLEILLINRRDGAWERPAIPSWGQEFKGLVIGLVVIGALVFAHPYLSGVAIR